ncbi:MAG: pseudouridine synthase [Candidatus Lernaella stagnicola]|nr:pseudouridine synthase [Candidatus Lernaella stagnicola]
MKITEKAPTPLVDFLARAGFGGKREATRLIAAGRVKVNGQVETNAQRRVLPADDHVRVDQKLIKEIWPPTYILMNKPPRTISTTYDPQDRKTVYALLGKYGKVVQSVGRLDYETEGVLLFTNDGTLAHALTSPTSKVQKVYRVKVKGQVNAAELQRLRDGVDIGGFRTAPAQVHVLSRGKANTWLRIKLTEGKYRQVKRMTKAVGHPVIRLVREKFGPLEAGLLKAGQWRHLHNSEVRQLRSIAGL